MDDNEQGSLLGGAVLAMELAGVIGDVRDFDPAPATSSIETLRDGGIFMRKNSNSKIPEML